MVDIAEKAMHVSLNIKQWSARKSDKVISNEIAMMKNAREDAGIYTKRLIRDKSLTWYQKNASAAREYYYKRTLPWSKDMRVLMSKGFESFNSEMVEFKANAEAFADEFCSHYVEAYERARNELGELFEPSDYPSEAAIRSRFGFSIRYSPIPLSNDWRVAGLTDKVNSDCRRAIEANTKECIADAMRDVWKRLYTRVEKMADRLSDEDAVFHSTLVTNLIELTDLLPMLNLMDDKNLAHMGDDIREKLCVYDADTLRHNFDDRKKVATEATTILDRMKECGYV